MYALVPTYVLAMEFTNCGGKQKKNLVTLYFLMSLLQCNYIFKVLSRINQHGFRVWFS